MTPEQKQELQFVLTQASEKAANANKAGKDFQEIAAKILDRVRQDENVPPQLITALETLNAQGYAISLLAGQEVGAEKTISQLTVFLQQA